MKQTVVLKSTREVNSAHRLIDMSQTQDGTHEMIIKPKEEKRRPLQNRLYHHWIGEIKNQIDGSHRKTIEAMCKMDFGVPVRYMREDDDVYRGLIDKIRASYTYEEQLAIFETSAIEVTRNLYVSEMHEVLTMMEQYWSREGIRLTTSDDLYFNAMAKKRWPVN